MLKLEPKHLFRMAIVCLLSLTGGLSIVVQGEEGSPASNPHQGHHGMKMDATGMVMNSNSDRLPEDCEKISRDYTFTVKAGVDYARMYADKVFGMSQHEWQVEPCSRITVTFENTDSVRHQWMVHGLPRYLYDQGMFHLESAGGHSQTGTFIVPSDDRTYLVHCDVSQHMEKGMKGQLVVGKGNGTLWSVPGVSSEFERDDKLTNWAVYLFICGFFSILAYSLFSRLR